VTGEVVENVRYKHHVGFMGWHGKPAIHLIFARALSGTNGATDWKPNIAAAWELHYTYRNANNAWKQTMNWVYPGIGIHVASLDQGNDSFEVGTGVNVSLFDGLIAGGFGYNFSRTKDPKYIFVGVNLLSALNNARGIAGK
jgi:hypothetical protein